MAPSSQPRPLRLSQQLADIAEQTGPDRLSFTDLAKQLHRRAWGGLLFIFAAINVIPLPPATSWIFAIPLMLVSAQMLFGRATPWFPKRLDRRGVTRDQLRLLVARVKWLEQHVERVLKPRLLGLTGPTATRLIGLVCLFLALAAAIPIPLFHMAPAAAAVLFGLALIYHDGALVIVATLASLLAVVVDALIIGSGVVALSYAASWLHL